MIAPIARKENLVIQQADDELLVYDLDSNKAICLNRTSALIWENCDGKKDFQQLAIVIESKLGELVGEDFVEFAIDQLKKENLIENHNEVITDFNGLSRREVIKKIGFTSLVAFPIIASLTAPNAANAASTCTGGTFGIACSCNMSGTNNMTRMTGGNCASMDCMGGGCRCRNLDCSGSGGMGGSGFCNGLCS